MAEDAEVISNGDGNDDETVKRSPLSKKANILIEYFNPHAPEKDEFFLIVLAMVEALS